jgi:hypothetical protein
MSFRPICADFVIQNGEGYDLRPEVQNVDISGIILDILGDDDDLVLSFVNDPLEFPELFDRVAELPDVKCSHPRFDVGRFDLAHALNDELSRNSSDEDILAAWHRWRRSAMAARAPEAAAKTIWDARADTLRVWLGENLATTHPMALVPFMTQILKSPTGLTALRASLEDPPIDVLEALKLHKALDA